MKKPFLATAIFSIAISFCQVIKAEEASDAITEASVYLMEFEGYSEPDGTGYYFDMLRAIYEPAGVKLKLNIVPWERALNTIYKKRGDITIATKEDYKIDGNKVYYSPLPIELNHTHFIAKKETPFVDQNSFKGKNLGWIRGYDWNTIITPPKKTYNIHDFSTLIQGLKMLEADRIDYLIDYQDTVKGEAEEEDFDLSGYKFIQGWPEKGLVGVVKNARGKKLLEIYEAGIKRIHKSGELEKILQKYTDLEVLPENTKENFLKEYGKK